MGHVRDDFLDTAGVAVDLLAEPAIADAWERPSALEGYTVAGLAGHLAGQIFFVLQVMAEPVPEQEPVSLLEYFARADWIDAPPDAPVHERFRRISAALAEDGAEILAERAAHAVADLRESLPAAPARTMRLPTWGDWSISLDDFVVTRTMELVIHVDDLAVSAQIPTPDLPKPAVETVVDLLARLAVRRHGATHVLRALSRAERAPETVAAI
jgi:uncharacterized protein (TIGR03083 family)